MASLVHSTWECVVSAAAGASGIERCFVKIDPLSPSGRELISDRIVARYLDFRAGWKGYALEGQEASGDFMRLPCQMAFSG